MAEAEARGLRVVEGGPNAEGELVEEYLATLGGRPHFEYLENGYRASESSYVFTSQRVPRLTEAGVHHWFRRLRLPDWTASFVSPRTLRGAPWCGSGSRPARGSCAVLYWPLCTFCTTSSALLKVSVSEFLICCTRYWGALLLSASEATSSLLAGKLTTCR